MIQTLLKYLLSKLAGITAQQWSAALLWVLNASRQFKEESGASKKERVLAILKKQFPDMENWKLDTLIQFALLFLRHQNKA